MTVVRLQCCVAEQIARPLHQAASCITSSICAGAQPAAEARYQVHRCLPPGYIQGSNRLALRTWPGLDPTEGVTNLCEVYSCLPVLGKECQAGLKQQDLSLLLAVLTRPDHGQKEYGTAGGEWVQKSTYVLQLPGSEGHGDAANLYKVCGLGAGLCRYSNATFAG